MNDIVAGVGDKEVAQELAGKGKEHAQLAKEARTKANQAAYDSSNLTVANRFKVSAVLFCALLCCAWTVTHCSACMPRALHYSAVLFSIVRHCLVVRHRLKVCPVLYVMLQTVYL